MSEQTEQPTTLSWEEHLRRVARVISREQNRMHERVEQDEALIADLRARLAHTTAERDDALRAAAVNRAMTPPTSPATDRAADGLGGSDEH